LGKIVRLFALSTVVAIAAWVVGYTYLVKIAGYSAAGFFTVRMVVGLLLVSFTLCLIFSLPEFFQSDGEDES
jgi:hypothetical protein